MTALKARVSGAWVTTAAAGAARLGGVTIPFPSGAPPTSFSLFTTQVPASLDSADGTDSYTLGSYMASSVAGTITHIRWPFPITAQPGGVAPKANVFRVLDNAKMGGADALFPMPGTRSTPGVPAWNAVALTTPWHITAGTEFCAAIWTPLRYVASTGGASPWPITNGPLSSLSNAGRFASGASGQVDVPGSTFNNGCYFVDVIFVPD